MLAFQIGGEEHDHVRVEILWDNEDGWLSVQVTISAGAFRGTYPASFNSWAFSDFANELERLHGTASGTATVTSYERQLELKLACDIMGYIEVRGEAMDSAGTGSRLNFRIQIDQTYAPKILRELRHALEKYPERAV